RTLRPSRPTMGAETPSSAPAACAAGSSEARAWSRPRPTIAGELLEERDADAVSVHLPARWRRVASAAPGMGRYRHLVHAAQGHQHDGLPRVRLVSVRRLGC